MSGYSGYKSGASYVIDRYVDQKANYCRRGNVYFDGDTMYSYGRHFPLVIRKPAAANLKDGRTWYLCNGDRYSVTTSRHQSTTFNHSELKEQPRIAFSALQAIPIRPHDDKLELLDFAPDYYSDWPKSLEVVDGSHEYVADGRTFEEWRKAQPMGATVSVERDNDTKEVIKAYAHRVGVVLFRYPNRKPNPHGECSDCHHWGSDCTCTLKGYRYFLAGMDEGSYFISELARPARTIDAALIGLKPKAVRDAEANGAEVQRQGDWFFISLNGTAPSIPDRAFKQQNFPIKEFQRDRRHNNHIARLHMVRDPKSHRQLIYAKGVVYHRSQWGRRGDHRSIKLDGICLAVQNTSVADWSASGSVD